VRRIALIFVLLLVAATPAFGDDVGKKHAIDTKITSLQGHLAAQKQQEQAIRDEVDRYTTRIRDLEGRVGDVSLRLKTLEQDLALHQKRLNALNALFHVQDTRYRTLHK